LKGEQDEWKIHVLGGQGHLSIDTHIPQARRQLGGLTALRHQKINRLLGLWAIDKQKRIGRRLHDEYWMDNPARMQDQADPFL